jgi:periplasmic divalent cation tolerance protein
MSNELVVFVTAPSVDDARRIASELVSERLAACVSIVPSIESVYRWKDEIEVSAEALLIIKTTGARYDQLETQLKALHQYTTPEVVALRIERGLASYLKWLRDSTATAS